ncbi:hypothetical protein [Kitasatospora cineracea]|uniref:hypothetical protein n=1 Tax=Kitasatospora cineracea TaxID=88074 RepID=UPI001FC94200|nr:hypothetical protein [Kitasatospora cineracea]
MRLEAAKRFERGDGNRAIAADLLVAVRPVEWQRQAWWQGGSAGLESKAPQSLPQPGKRQSTQLERELEKEPLAHGREDQGWTLARTKTVIGRQFHVSHMVQGVWKNQLWPR